MVQIRYKKSEIQKQENQLELKIKSNNDLKKKYYQKLGANMEAEIKEVN